MVQVISSNGSFWFYTKKKESKRVAESVALQPTIVCPAMAESFSLK